MNNTQIFNVSLQKAHKILNLLKQMKNTVANANYTAYKTQVSVSVTEGFGTLVKNANNLEKELRDNVDLELAIIEAIGNVKKAIFVGNVNSGVNDLIEDYSVLQQRLQILKKVADASKSNKPKINDVSEDTFNRIAAVEIENRSQNVKFDLKLIDDETAALEVKALNKKLIEIADLKTEKNASFKINIEIPVSLVEELML